MEKLGNITEHSKVNVMKNLVEKKEVKKNDFNARPRRVPVTKSNRKTLRRLETR